jgi:hypothetical protein
MGSCEVIFLQVQPHLISNMELVWYSMLIMALIVLGIGFLQNIMKLLLDVHDALNKFGSLISLSLSMGGLFLCNYKWAESHQWGLMVGTPRTPEKACGHTFMEGYFVVMLNIRKDFIPCACIFGIVHRQDMENHLVDYLCLSISLFVEGNQLG